MSRVIGEPKVRRELGKLATTLARRFAAASTTSVVHRALIEKGYRQGFSDAVDLAVKLTAEEDERRRRRSQ